MENKTPKFKSGKKNFENDSYIRNYRRFRKSGLGIYDSFFNAMYIALCVKHNDEKDDFSKNVSEYPFIFRLFSKAPYKIRNFYSRLKKLFFRPTHKDPGTAKLNRRRLFWRANYSIVIAAGFLLCGATYLTLKFNMPVVMYAEIDGTVVGKVDDQTTMLGVINELEQNVSKVLGTEFKFPYKVGYTFKSEFGTKLSEKQELTDNLYSMLRDYITTASGLYVDNSLVLVSEKRGDIEMALDKILKSAREEAEAESSGNKDKNKDDEGGICFLNDVTILEQAYPTKAILDRQKIDETLRSIMVPLSERQKNATKMSAKTVSSNEKKIVIDGESSVKGIVSDADYHVNDSSSYGTTTNLSDIYLMLATKKSVTYDEEIPFGVQYAESKSLYNSMIEIKQKGEKGKQKVTAEVYYVDGVEMKREVTETKVSKAAKNQIISVGIKMLPEDMGITGTSGRFILPYNGIITSKFGLREEGNHKGWDIAGKTGDKIYAAASGKVVTVIGRNINKSAFPGRSYSGYGYVIVIDHGNNWYTLYAHLNDTAVYYGQEVKQGEFIGYLGNSGKSTGSHVHFEIMHGDTKLNPAKGYLYNGTYTIYDKYPIVEN